MLVKEYVVAAQNASWSSYLNTVAAMSEQGIEKMAEYPYSLGPRDSGRGLSRGSRKVTATKICIWGGVPVGWGGSQIDR
jgi:hypothetical protein